MAKTGTLQPFPEHLKPKEASREEEINSALENVEDLSMESIGDLCKKLHLAVIKNGFILTKEERESLKTLSQKCIPEVPKEIHLDAKISTESVILNFLNTNELARERNMESIQDHINHEQILNQQIIPALAEELGIPD